MADRHTDDGSPETNSESDTNRRTFIKTVGATIAMTASASQAIGSSVAQSTSEYRTIQVSGVERFDIHNDFNGHLENVLFDQREDGAMAEILAMGGDFTIRNVGFLGRAGGSGSRKQIKPSVTDSSGVGVIENVFLPGAEFDNNDCMGMYAPQDHAGTLKIRNVTIQGYSDNGMYVSVPGSIDSAHDQQGHGEVHIENCFGRNNNIAQFRIGSDGSYVENSVAVVDDQSQFPQNANGHKNGRGIWFRNQANVTARNCEVWQTTGTWAVAAADGGNGPTRLVDSRVRGDIQSGIAQENVQSLASVPSRPDGVPTSAEAAASGQSGSGSGGGDNDSGQEDEDPLANRFVVMSTTANEELSYRFWVDGDVTLETDGSAQVTAEAGDESVGQEDGLTVVTGSTGNQYGDAFDLAGEVLAFEQTGGNSEYALYDDGTDVTADVPESLPDEEEDPLEGRFVVMSTTPLEELSYEFWVDGSVTPATDTATNVAAESGDESVTTDGEYVLASGSTGNEYGDAFDYEGDIVAFARTGGASEYQLLDDGEDVTDALPAEPPSEGDGEEGSTTRFTVVATTGGEEMDYRFVADGPVEPIADTDDPVMAAEPGGNDSVTQRDDDLYEVTGHTGNQCGDTFDVDGTVLMFERTGGSSNHALYADGEDVTQDVPTSLPSDGPPSGTLLIDGTGAPDETARYTVSVTESISYDADRSTTVDGGLPWDDMEDTVDGTRATGVVGNGVDAYAIVGEVENIEIRGDAEYTVEWE